MRLSPVFFFVLLLSFSLAAQNKIDVSIKKLLNDPDLKHASLGVCVLDVKKNKVIASTNAQQALIPASSMKVVTTGTALAILGKKYRFKTYLEHDGSIVNGILKGNLYLRGTGDPTLGSSKMPNAPTHEELYKEFAQALRKAGIKRVEGYLIGDAQYFENKTVVPTWQWGDIGNGYGAGVAGLNFHDNFFYINFEKHYKWGGRPKIKELTPAVPNLKLSNEVSSAGSKSGDNAYIYIAPYASTGNVVGTIPKGSGLFLVKGASPNPALFAAYNFRKGLIAQGISFGKSATTTQQKKVNNPRKILHTHYSNTLDSIVKHCNEKSRNIYCEALLKAMGKKTSGKGTCKAGIAAVLNFWRDRGMNMNGFFMKDGSGLSPRSAVSTQSMAQIMRKLFIDKKSFGSFYDYLAIAGVNGTLKRIGLNTAAANNVHAKSGSLNRVRSYTGYVNTKSGELLAFSIIVNNYSCSGSLMRKKLETFMVAMAESRL